MNKRIVAILIVLISVIALLLFLKQEKTDSNDEQIKIGFVVPTLDNPFFVDMTSAAQKKAKGFKNVTVLVQATQSVEDALGQNQIIDNLITQRVDAICVVPTNSESILSVLKRANSAGIPIINIDNKIDMEMARTLGVEIASYVGSDNYEGGKLAGEYIKNALGGSGKVAILEGVSGNEAANNRKSGFLEGIKGADDIVVVTSQVANWNREQAFNLFQNMLKSYPDLNAVFAANDEMALGAMAALEQDKSRSKNDLVIVGFDAIDEVREMINQGRINATIAQQPRLMGEESVELAFKFLTNEQINKSNSVELEVIEKK